MPWEAGGQDGKLITGLTKGDSSIYSCGRWEWLAQTFTITTQPAINLVGLKCYALQPWKQAWCGIRNTDAVGMPTGPDLYTAYLEIPDSAHYGPPKWYKARFYHDLTLSPGTYALIIRQPTEIVTTGLKIEGNATPPGFTQGKAWRSVDAGSTWTEIPGVDLLFQVWGYEPPPPPPPKPVISNWAPFTITFTPVPTGVKIIVTTDIPCHLYMRWTTEPPLKHKKVVPLRGTRTMDATRFCFVSFHENEQDEIGDTLIHTFLKGNWPYCQTRYFYFLGTKQLTEVPSASAIFEYHQSIKAPEQYFFAYPPDKLILGPDDTWFKVTSVTGGLLKDLLPAETSVLFFHINHFGPEDNLGFRPVGSTHNETGILASQSHLSAHVGVNSDNEFEIFVGNKLRSEVFLIGYALSSAVTMLTNPIEKIILGGPGWKDVSTIPEGTDATGVMVETAKNITGQISGLRKKGSSDNYLAGLSHAWALLGLDQDAKFQCYPDYFGGYDGKLYITGFITQSAVFNTNAIDITPTPLGIYQTIELQPGPHLAFLQIFSSSGRDKYALRSYGNTEDIYAYNAWAHCFAVIPPNIVGWFEGKKESDKIFFYHLGSGT